MNKLLKIVLIGLMIGGIQSAMAGSKYEIETDGDGRMSVSSCPGSKSIEELRQTIIEIMLVNPQTGKGGSKGSEEKYQYLNNIDSVRENQNKIRINAAARSVAVGKRAVALATGVTDDVEGRTKEVQKRDDMLRMLKGIAKLQAQHLQKTSAITAMRAKIMELNAIDNIIAGDVYAKTVSSKTDSSK